MARAGVFVFAIFFGCGFAPTVGSVRKAFFFNLNITLLVASLSVFFFESMFTFLREGLCLVVISCPACKRQLARPDAVPNPRLLPVTPTLP